MPFNPEEYHKIPALIKSLNRDEKKQTDFINSLTESALLSLITSQKKSNYPTALHELASREDTMDACLPILTKLSEMKVAESKEQKKKGMLDDCILLKSGNRGHNLFSLMIKHKTAIPILLQMLSDEAINLVAREKSLYDWTGFLLAAFYQGSTVVRIFLSRLSDESINFVSTEEGDGDKASFLTVARYHDFNTIKMLLEKISPFVFESIFKKENKVFLNNTEDSISKSKVLSDPEKKAMMKLMVDRLYFIENPGHALSKEPAALIDFMDCYLNRDVITDVNKWILWVEKVRKFYEKEKKILPQAFLDRYNRIFLKFYDQSDGNIKKLEEFRKVCDIQNKIIYEPLLAKIGRAYFEQYDSGVERFKEFLGAAYKTFFLILSTKNLDAESNKCIGDCYTRFGFPAPELVEDKKEESKKEGAQKQLAESFQCSLYGVELVLSRVNYNTAYRNGLLHLEAANEWGLLVRHLFPGEIDASKKMVKLEFSEQKREKVREIDGLDIDEVEQAIRKEKKSVPLKADFVEKKVDPPKFELTSDAKKVLQNKIAELDCRVKEFSAIKWDVFSHLFINALSYTKENPKDAEEIKQLCRDKIYCETLVIGSSEQKKTLKKMEENIASLMKKNPKRAGPRGLFQTGYSGWLIEMDQAVKAVSRELNLVYTVPSVRGGMG